MKDNCPWYVELPIIEPPRFITYPGVMPKMYTITDFGLVTNVVKGFKVSQFINNGYYKCDLVRKDSSQYQYSIHRLVAWEYVQYRRDYNLHINHKDGNKLNNNWFNLEWVTPAENTQHAWRTGLVPEHLNQGETHGMSKLRDEDVHLLCQMLENPKVTYDEVLEALDYKVSRGCIIRLVNGSHWSHITKLYNIPERFRGGESHPNAVLTNRDVHAICFMLQNPRNSYEYIAEQFKDKCKISTIIDIAHGRTWTHISSQYTLPFREWDRPRGEETYCSILTTDEVHKICSMLEDPKCTYNEIAELIGDHVSMSAVFHIANGDTWKHISSQYNIVPRENDRVKAARVNSKLDVFKVHLVCEMLQDPTITFKEVGDRFGVCDHNILDIAHGRIWKDVSSQYQIPPRSSKNHTVSKLTSKEVEQICELLSDPYITYKEISSKFKVSISCIQAIANGYNWQDVSSKFNILSRIRKKSMRKDN